MATIFESIYFSEFYQNLLDKYKSTLILYDSDTLRRNIVANMLFANSKTNNPVIIIINSKQIMDELIFALGSEYKVCDANYTDIENLKTENNDNKLLFILTRPRGFYLATELAMMANKTLLRQGYKPLVIFESFDEIYNGDIDDRLIDFFNDVILDNTDIEQNIVFAANWLGLKPHNVSMFEVNTDIMLIFNAIIVTTRFLKEKDELKITNLNLMSQILSYIWGKKKVKEKMKQIKELSYLENGFVLDLFDEGIGELKL